MSETNVLTYAIIKTIDFDKVDFVEVVQEPTTVRYNLAGTQFVIKYNSTPSFISDGSVIPDAILNHSDCLALMATNVWYTPIE